MAQFTSTFKKSYRLDATAEAAAAHFGDPLCVARNYGDLDHHELIDPKTIKLVLKEHHYGVTRFRGEYTCRYDHDATSATWKTLKTENLDSSGTARFRDHGDGTCTMDYDARLVLEINVPRLMKAVIGGVVETLAARGMSDFVERMIAALNSRGET